MKPIEVQLQPMRRRLRRLRQHLYRVLFQPRAEDEDTQRREFIFLVLIGGMITLVGLALYIVISHALVEGSSYTGASPLVLLTPFLFLVGLFSLARQGFRPYQVYCFLGIFIVLATYALVIFGFSRPQALLSYALIIVMAGILLSARATFAVTGVVIGCLLTVTYLQLNGITHPDIHNVLDKPDQSDVVVYAVIFVVIVLVSWLSNRDIARSLKRARRSEAALIRERNSLEDKVLERTEELERVQAEKVFQLHRFAEIGRVSATLLHELTNPLTSVSLELEQLDNLRQAGQLEQIKQGVAAMEQYVTAARRQLRSESEVKLFDCCESIERLAVYLKPWSQRERVKVALQLPPTCQLKGDAIRFDQIMANLISNAIDAYSGVSKPKKVVTVTVNKTNNQIEIVVQDYGKGIKAAEINAIFEPFYSTKPVERGTGIGLSITKRAVEEVFGGTIVATSNKRIGTKFIVSLPLHEPS